MEETCIIEGLGCIQNRQAPVALSYVHKNLSSLKGKHVFALGKLYFMVSVETSDNEFLKKVNF